MLCTCVACTRVHLYLPAKGYDLVVGSSRLKGKGFSFIQNKLTKDRGGVLFLGGGCHESVIVSGSLNCTFQGH